MKRYTIGLITVILLLTFAKSQTFDQAFNTTKTELDEIVSELTELKEIYSNNCNVRQILALLENIGIGATHYLTDVLAYHVVAENAITALALSKESINVFTKSIIKGLGKTATLTKKRSISMLTQNMFLIISTIKQIRDDGNIVYARDQTRLDKIENRLEGLMELSKGLGETPLAIK